MSDTDAEDLISYLCGGLAPNDREAFRKAAESALASSPQCWGPGSIYRALVPFWRKYFHPLANDSDQTTTWNQRRRASKLISEPPLADNHDRRRSRNLRNAR
jgi:hypothetical protein